MNKIQVLIQVAAGSRDKNLYDEKTLTYKETRQVSYSYPYAYGFIPGTRGADGDCIDCYVLTRTELARGAIVECEPIGLLEQREDDELDHKILAQLPGENVALTQALEEELRNFIYTVFAQYPEIQVQVGPVHSAETAQRYLEHSIPNQSFRPK